MDLTIRPARESDAAAFADLYRPIVEQTIFSFEETAPDAGEFARRVRTTIGDYPWLAAERDGRVVGYAYAHRHRERSAYRYSAEVSIYVAGSVRRVGVGRALYQRLFPELAQRGFHRAFAAIAVPNDASVALHASCGFTPIGVFEQVGRKFDRWLDVLCMQRPV